MARNALSTFLAALPALAALAAASAAATQVPATSTPAEAWDREIVAPPPKGNLGELLLELDRRITGPDVSEASGLEVGPENIPSVDRYVADLEEQLSKGSDAPREKVLTNALKGREDLRQAHDRVASAVALIVETQTALKKGTQTLSSLLRRNRASVRRLEAASRSARATVGAMEVSPPSSPGGLVPLAPLCAIVSIEPELRSLKGELERAASELRRAMNLAGEAGRISSSVGGHAERGADLYSGIMDRLNDRRGLNGRSHYFSNTQSPEVLVNANEALAGAVEAAGRVAGLQAAQLDARRPGLMSAVVGGLEANGRTLDGKALGERHGSRINYNHTVRLQAPDGLIPRGWESAAPQRKPWWEGRANMARSESRADGDVMEASYREAEEAAETPEETLTASIAEIARIEDSLGPTGSAPRRIAHRPTSGKEGDEPLPARQGRSSGNVSVPRALGAPRETLPRSFDGVRR